LDGFTNPLMVKGVLQSLRSRGFLISNLLALGLPLLMFIGPLFDDVIMSRSSQGSGRNYYSVIISVLSFAVSLFLPLRAAHELNGEIKSRTIDLLMLTSLSPWELAVGRFQASAVQIVLLLAFVMPFAVAALGLGGIGASMILANLAFATLQGCVQCCAALLAVSTSLISRTCGVLASGMFAVQLVLSNFIGALLLVERDRLSAPPFLWACVLLIGTICFLLRLTADVFTRGDRSTSAYSKLMLAGLLAVLCLPFTWGWLAPLGGSRGSERGVALACALTALYYFGVAWSSAPERKATPKLARFWLLSDGQLATTAYLAVLSLALTLVSQGERERVLPLACLAYFIFFSGLAALTQALLPESRRTREFYFGALILWFGLDLVVSLPFIDAEWNRTFHESSWLAFLPTAALSHRLLEHPLWLLWPGCVGALALLGARARNALTGGRMSLGA
jgi:ABC-type transport system involved in multi-copper enzyme maturation permease subunit